jgi:hypothetical protein
MSNATSQIIVDVPGTTVDTGLGGENVATKDDTADEWTYTEHEPWLELDPHSIYSIKFSRKQLR